MECVDALRLDSGCVFPFLIRFSGCFLPDHSGLPLSLFCDRSKCQAVYSWIILSPWTNFSIRLFASNTNISFIRISSAADRSPFDGLRAGARAQSAPTCLPQIQPPLTLTHQK